MGHYGVRDYLMGLTSARQLKRRYLMTVVAGRLSAPPECLTRVAHALEISFEILTCRRLYVL